MQTDIDKDCYSIAEFCHRHSISRTHYFLIRADGLGPREIRIGGKVLISREAAETWRREREHETAATNAA